MDNSIRNRERRARNALKSFDLRLEKAHPFSFERKHYGDDSYRILDSSNTVRWGDREHAFDVTLDEAEQSIAGLRDGSIAA